MGALPQKSLKIFPLNGAFGAVPKNVMKVKIRSKVRGFGSEKRQHDSKEVEYCLRSLFFFSNIKGVLCSFIWLDLCQTLPGDGICTSSIFYVIQLYDMPY